MKSRQRGVPITQDSIGVPTFVGLEILFRAHCYAVDTGSDDWDFAVEIGELERAGLSKSEFRWLLAHGYADHAEEVTLPDSEVRQFKPLGKHQFTDATCFVLREKGLAFVEGDGAPHLRSSSDVVVRSADVEESNEMGNGQLTRGRKPIWDSTEKELWLEGLIVKRFRWPAPNQELLLDVFEEESWPRRIDDPLSKVPEQDPRRRLHDTIKCLNRNQQNRLIRFRGDGSGEGVAWELVEDSTPSGQ
jgi:hypothetical protein